MRKKEKKEKLKSDLLTCWLAAAGKKEWTKDDCQIRIEESNPSLGGEPDGGVEGVEGAVGPLHGVLHDGHVAHQHGAARVDGERAPVVH